MKRLHIAFTGTHGVGKDALVLATKAMLAELYIPAVKVLESSGRWVHEKFGTKMNEDTEDSNQYLRQAVRRFWEQEATEKGYEVVLSPRCAIDEVCYQGVYFSRKNNEFMAKLQSGGALVDSNGNAILTQSMNEEHARIQISQSYLHVLLDQASQEVESFWDFIYWKRPGNYEIEDDGVRSLDPSFQKLIDDQFRGLLRESHGLKWVDRVIELPGELTEAEAFLREHELPKWVEQWQKEETILAG
jgi:thymidylate kinase